MSAESGLNRVEYDNPPIVRAVLQVLLSWNHAEMLEVVDEFEEEAKKKFKSVERLKLNEFQVRFSSSGMEQVRKESQTGLKCEVATGHYVLVELESAPKGDGVAKRGLRCVQDGAYRGREELLDGMRWWLDRIRKSKPNVVSDRISCLALNRITPGVPDDETYEISDYLVPTFELGDKRLQLFNRFRHEIELNLTELADSATRGIVVAETARPGISLMIDIVKEAEFALGDVETGLRFVKDIETHVFENCITEKTRSMYGRRK